jgi:rod shape-determining protein MreD
MKNEIVANTVRFLGLLLLQFYVMDQIFFMGYINPMIYILFIVLYPMSNKRWTLLFLSFILGIIIDTYQDTGGAHAAAAVTLTYVRPVLLKLVFGESYLTRNVKVMESSLDRIALIIALSVVVHHLVYFSLIIFNLVQILEILKLTLVVGIATFFVSFLGTVLFSKKANL